MSYMTCLQKNLSVRLEKLIKLELSTQFIFTFIFLTPLADSFNLYYHKQFSEKKP